MWEQTRPSGLEDMALLLSAALGFAHLAVVLAAALLVILAAVSDIRRYIIPNRLVVLLAALFPVWAVLAPSMPPLWGHLIVGAAGFLLGLGLYSLRWMGGGDAKLIAALALWAGPERWLSLLVVTALAGGLVSIAVAVRQIVQRRGRRRVAEPSILPAVAVPYGVAIAAGGLHMFWDMGWPTIKPFMACPIC